jgi:hypothetical protein
MTNIKAIITSRVRLVLLCSLAVLALGGVTSTSASAACEAKSASWCIGGKVFEGEETYSSVGKTFTLSTTIAGEPITLECTTETGGGTIKAGNDGVNFNRYGGSKTCKTSLAACGVAEPIESAILTSQLTTAGGKVYHIFKRESGSLATITITGATCVLKGKYEVFGQGCSEIGPEAVALKWKFSKSIEEACKTELKFGGKEGPKATLTGESTQELIGKEKGKTWGAAP